MKKPDVETSGLNQTTETKFISLTSIAKFDRPFRP